MTIRAAEGAWPGARRSSKGQICCSSIVADALKKLSDHELVHRLSMEAATRGLTLLIDETGGVWHARLHPIYAVDGPDRRTAMIRLARALENEGG